MKEFVEKLIGRLRERLKFYENRFEELSGTERDTEDWGSIKSYKDTIEIVNQLAEEYKECYKDCCECEAYDKENHHCPKYCKLIRDAVKDIEENYNRWIPCSERLPENISTVLVQVKEIEKPTLGWYGNMDGWRLSEKDFAELEDFTVIAWQPLPPKFEPKGE